MQLTPSENVIFLVEWSYEDLAIFCVLIILQFLFILNDIFTQCLFTYLLIIVDVSVDLLIQH